MKLLKFLGIFVLTLVGVSAGVYGCIRLDVLINPWLKELTYSRWMWLTTRHAAALSYLNGTAGWWILTLIVGVVIALLVAQTVCSRS